MENLVKKFEIVFLEKSKEELDFLSEILNHPSDTKFMFASSKEMKIIISKIQEELHGLGTDQDISENVADLFFSCGIISPPKHWIEYLKNPKNRELLEWAAEWRGVMVKLTGIHDASERVSKIVQSLRTYTHMDPNAEKKKTDIRDSIETVLTIFQHSFKMGIQVEREFESISQIDCYPDALIQVWSNLTQNAVQAMSGKGNLQISVNSIENSGKKWIRVCFSDTGPGISEKDQKKIFQAFFSTKLAGEGTGLGLYISRQIVEKHGGKIWFETSRSGTKFFVDLPA
jgi:signal transduction histidine kinase